MSQAFRLPQQFIKPQYGSRCFSDIPQLIRWSLLGGATPDLQPDGFTALPQRYQRVVVLFVDAFGWRFFEQNQDRYPFLSRFAQQGSVTKLTAQFPSTTAAHVTTLYSGLPVGQHGVFEWFFYEPTVDRLIAPLLWSFAGDQGRETLLDAGIEVSQIAPEQSVAEEMAGQGVRSLVFQHRGFAQSTYSSAICRGAEVMPFATLPEALTNVAIQAAAHEGPLCCYLYIGDVDTTCHKYGPGSPQMEAEVDALMTVLERWFQRQVQGRVDDTLLVLLADHGQIEVDPATTVYLNQMNGFAELRPLLRTNRRGQLLVPGGSCRDMFLYVRDEHLDEAENLLARLLGGAATVTRVSDLIEAGYFGPAPISPRFLSRVGNLVLLPNGHRTVWWYEKGRFEQKYYGHHGGLTPEELEIPLLLLPLGQ